MLTFKISLQNYLDVFQESIELLIQRAASLYKTTKNISSMYSKLRNSTVHITNKNEKESVSGVGERERAD